MSHDRKNPAVTPEPPPERSASPAVWPLVIATVDRALPQSPPWLRERLRADMQARHEVGVERYGMPLQVENGRDAATDAYQEALDLCAYSRQQAERTGSMAWRTIHEDALSLAASILYQLELERAER